MTAWVDHGSSLMLRTITASGVRKSPFGRISYVRFPRNPAGGLQPVPAEPAGCLIRIAVIRPSFGTGWLMTQYADRFEVHGVDLNNRMVDIAQENLDRSGLSAKLQQGNVESLPFSDELFDTVLCTMAFSGYPNAQRALSEMVRVLKPIGRIVLIDVNYPANENWFGVILTRFWARSGDLVRDMDTLFEIKPTILFR